MTQYHELRVLIPTTSMNMNGVQAARLIHDAIAEKMELAEETAPVLVMWEQLREVAASGAL